MCWQDPPQVPLPSGETAVWIPTFTMCQLHDKWKEQQHLWYVAFFFTSLIFLWHWHWEGLCCIHLKFNCAQKLVPIIRVPDNVMQVVFLTNMSLTDSIFAQTVLNKVISFHKCFIQPSYRLPFISNMLPGGVKLPISELKTDQPKSSPLQNEGHFNLNQSLHNRMQVAHAYMQIRRLRTTLAHSWSTRQNGFYISSAQSTQHNTTSK